MFISQGFKFISVVSMLALVGCASAPPRAPIAIDLGAEKTFTIKSVNAEGERINSSQVANAISAAIYRASSFAPVRDIATEYMPHLDGSKVAVTSYRGLGVTQMPNAFKVAYIKGQRAGRGYGSDPVPTGAIFGFSIDEGEKLITVKVTPPKDIEVAPKESYQLANDAAVLADIKRIYDKLDLQIAIVKTKSFKADVDVKYSTDAVKANFKRTAECPQYSYNSKFSCRFDGVHVDFEIVPYKEGSKTTYKFDIPYTLNGNGETTYSPEVAKKVIAKLESIVKD